MNSHPNPTHTFYILNKLIPKFTWKYKVLRGAKIILRKNKVTALLFWKARLIIKLK